MARVYLLLLLFSAAGSAAAQDYFPLSSIKSAYFYNEYSAQGPMGEDFHSSSWSNTRSIRDTVIGGKQFYVYKFGYSDKYFHYDKEKQILLMQNPPYSAIFPAADFTKQNGDKYTSYLAVAPEEYNVETGETTMWGKTRRVFTLKSSRFRFSFAEGIGLISSYISSGAMYTETRQTYLKGAVIDTTAYNPITAVIDSVDKINDQFIYKFPLTVNVSAAISNKAFIDTFYIEAKISRGGTVFYEKNFKIDTSKKSAVINIDTSLVRDGDIFSYRAVYRDTSIFLNSTAYPEEGYLSFKLKARPPDYFPLASIKGNYSLYGYHDSGPMGYSYHEYSYHASLTRDTLIDGLTYYHYSLGKHDYYLRNDRDSGKLYIYLPSFKAALLAADFSLKVNDYTTSFITGKGTNYRISEKDTILFWGKKRGRFKMYMDGNYIEFIEGIGLTGRQSVSGFPYSTIRNETIKGAIINDVFINPVTAKLNGVELGGEYKPKNFPLPVYVFASFGTPAFHDKFYLETILVRGDSVVLKQNFDVDTAKMEAVIDINRDTLKTGDKLNYRVVYKSVLLPDMYFPNDGGYNHFYIVDNSTAADDIKQVPRSFEISAPYPNPFNSSSAVKFYLPAADRVNLTLYDILGSTVKTLKDEEFPKGDHTVHINAGGLTSGVYLLRFNSGSEVRTYKILHLK